MLFSGQKNKSILKESEDSINQNKRDIKNGEEIAVAVNQITSVSQQLGITLEENQEFSAHVFNNAKKMTEINRIHDKELHSIIDETRFLFDRLKTVGVISGEMKNTGISSREVLGESLTETRSVVSSIQEIETSANQNLELMNDLKNISVTITNVLESVSDISDQTKLLSLNATIEAARAGNAGAGFGIVAQHIQRLSGATQDAVDNIHQLVEKLRTSIDGMSNAMRINAEKVTNVSKQSENVGTNLSRVERSFNALIDKSNEVSIEIADEQKQAAAVQKNLSNLQSNSSENIRQIEEVYRGLEKHHLLMDELKDLGSRLNHSSSALRIAAVYTAVITDESSEKLKAFGRDALPKLRKELNAGNCKALTLDFCKNLCDGILSHFSAFEAVWVNDVKGRFVYSNPPAGIANALVRDWFISSISGSDFVSAPYLSAITGKACITVSIPILNSGKEIVGVLGCDLHL